MFFALCATVAAICAGLVVLGFAIYILDLEYYFPFNIHEMGPNALIGLVISIIAAVVGYGVMEAWRTWY